MNSAFDNALAAELDVAREEHAAQIIDFMGFQMDGDWQQCLEIALVEYKEAQSPLWLAVCDGLRALIRQNALRSSERLYGYLIGDEDVPF